MSKFNRLIALSCTAVLCSHQMYAQSEQVRPMSINEMFSLADANSTSIRSFETAKEVADAALEAAKAERLPDVSASLSVSYIGDGYLWDRDFKNGQSISMPHFGNNFALQASQAVYTGGAITSGINLAKMGQKMAKLQADENRKKVRFMLVGYYLQLFKLNNQEQVFKQNIELTKKVINQMKARRDAGTVLKNDITRYELQLENLKLQRIRVTDDRKIINHQLNTVIGLPSTTEIAPDTTIVNTVPMPMAEADWQQMASQQSVALQQSQLSVEMNREKEKLEKSARLPKVAIFVEEHLDGPILIEVPVIDSNFNYWYAGVSVSYNISSLFKNNKKIKQAAITTRQSEQNHTLAKEHIENGVQASYTQFLTSFTDLDTQRKSVELAKQNYDVVNNRYSNELALITDMIDAANTKLTTELALVNSRINVVYNYYNMLYISGQL